MTRKDMADTQTNWFAALRGDDAYLESCDANETIRTEMVIVPVDSDDDAAMVEMVECHGDLYCECDACNAIESQIAHIVETVYRAESPRNANETKPWWWERLVLWLLS